MPFSRLQVFGFLLGIDLKGISGPGDEKEGDETRDMPPPSSAGGAQSDSKQAEQEEQEVNILLLPFPLMCPPYLLIVARSGALFAVGC